MAYQATKSRRITRTELLVLIGAGAMKNPDGWRRDGNGAYSVFCEKDLAFVKRHSVRITRKGDGSVRVDVLKYGKATT